jgi:short-subunit dehydrogenase
MKTVLLTGGSSGIGKAIKQTLQNVGYKVFNMGRNKADIECDLQDLKEVEKKLKKWLKNHEVDVLINCAGMGIFEPHEELNSTQIQNLTTINLTAPILITNLCLRSLKKTKGHIFNITSIEATRHSKFSALYTATKSGLRAFSLTLFEELRKAEVKVTSLNPDMTKTAFFDNLSFEPAEEEGTYLEPQNIAKTLLFILENRASVTDLTIRAPKFGIKKKQKNKE